MKLKKLLLTFLFFIGFACSISAKAQDNWTEWNITNQDFSDPKTKDYLFNRLPKTIDHLLSLKNDNYGENNVLVKEENRNSFTTLYLCALVGWSDYLKLSLCDAYGLELLTESETKVYDDLFPKMNTFSLDFLDGKYTDGQSPIDYEYFTYNSIVENVQQTLQNISEHIDIEKYINNPKAIPKLMSIRNKKENNTSKDNEIAKQSLSKSEIDFNISLILSILFSVIFIVLQFIFGKIRVRPILRSFTFGMIFISVVSVFLSGDGESIFSDDTALIFSGITTLLFTFVSYPLYKSIDKNKIKNNKYHEFNPNKNRKRLIENNLLNKKGIILSCTSFILGPISLFINIILRKKYNKNRKSFETLLIYKKVEHQSVVYILIQSILSVSIIFSNNLPYFSLIISLLWLLSGVIGLLCTNCLYSLSSLMELIINSIKSKQYLDIATDFEIDAKDCNLILYLKKKNIEDYSFNVKKMIVLSYTLHQINSFQAIGIQKVSKFYYINLESIFKKLDLNLTEEEKKNISDIIVNSYGNDKLDKFDWILSSSIGLITGIIDIFLVGKPGESKLQNIVDNFTEKGVRLAGKLNGITDEDLSKIVAKLEKKYWVPYDKATISEIGMGTENHHVQSLAHANDIIGLIFAIVDIKLSMEKTIDNGGKLYTVVTCNYSKDPETIKKLKEDSRFEFILGGFLVRLVEPLKYQSGKKKGQDKDISVLNLGVYKILYEKCKNADEMKKNIMFIIFGFILWLGHLYSDKIGASGTVAKGNRGSGIAAPFQELFIGASNNIAEKLKKIDPSKIDDSVSDIAKEMFEKGFDNRFYNTQKIPVLINEYLTKIVYIIKEIGLNNKNYTLKEIIHILFPENFIKGGIIDIVCTSDFELQKTLLVSYSVFSMVDVSDAFISSGAIGPIGIKPNIDTYLLINYAGLLKLGQESVSVFLSYLRRWTSSPEKISKRIERIALESDSLEN